MQQNKNRYIIDSTLIELGPIASTASICQQGNWPQRCLIENGGNNKPPTPSNVHSLLTTLNLKARHQEKH
jgi:hypothetical protein